jgi:hypothetical protein
MKKRKFSSLMCIFLPILAVICSSAFAQSFPTNKGSVMVYGSFAYSSAGGHLYEDDGDRLSTLQFNPSVSYFVTPGLALGGKFLLSRTSQGDASLTGFGIGPHLLYFIGGNKPKDKVKGTTYPYLGTTFLYSRATAGEDDEDLTISGTMFSFGFGVCHMLSNSVGLVGEAAYQIDNMTVKWEDWEGEEEEESESGDKFNLVAGFVVFLF